MAHAWVCVVQSQHRLSMNRKISPVKAKCVMAEISSGLASVQNRIHFPIQCSSKNCAWVENHYLAFITFDALLFEQSAVCALSLIHPLCLKQHFWHRTMSIHVISVYFWQRTMSIHVISVCFSHRTMSIHVISVYFWQRTMSIHVISVCFWQRTMSIHVISETSVSHPYSVDQSGVQYILTLYL